MTRVIDIRRWLDESGKPLPKFIRRVLRLARLIEYGGPLVSGASRRTLVLCNLRLGCRPCLGLLWVVKTEDRRISTFCQTCDSVEISILGWEATEWADGPSSPELPEVSEERLLN